jgi:phage recombination protein Bet
MTTVAAKSQAEIPASPPSLVTKFASRFGVEANKLLTTLKSTAFKGDVSNEQMMALLIVADQYGLNPWTREIYAFPDKHNGIVPVVGVDGWSRIINEHAQFNGLEFEYGEPSTKHKGAPEWIACTIWRKDRDHFTRIIERMDECYRATGPWDSHPGRMLRHKALIQSARIAFGFAGIYDEDEAQRILEGESVRVPNAAPAIGKINREVEGKPAIEGESTAEPDLLSPSPTGAPTKTDVLAKIAAIQTGGDVDLCRDLGRGLFEPDELDAMIDKRMKELATQASARK